MWKDILTTFVSAESWTREIIQFYTLATRHANGETFRINVSDQFLTPIGLHNGYLGAISLAVKRLWFEASQSCAFSTGVKNKWSHMPTYTVFPHMPSWMI